VEWGAELELCTVGIGILGSSRVGEGRLETWDSSKEASCR
jgi:hypothetical protein